LNFKRLLLFFTVLIGFTVFLGSHEAHAEQKDEEIPVLGDLYLPPPIEESVESNEMMAPTGIADPGYVLTPGDIFTTNATSSAGFAGHAGIAVSSYYILHIAGPGETTKLLTLSQWKTKYAGGTTWVDRVNNTTVRTQAANWAYTNYYSTGTTGEQNIKPNYFINHYTNSFDPTYCSKIVWQAYYYGTGSTPVIGSGVNDIIFPYYLRDGIYFNASYKPVEVNIWNL
jgi:hypothetical protein